MAVIRVAAKLVDGRSLGQVLMAFRGGALCGSWLSVLSARSSLLPAGEEDLRSPPPTPPRSGRGPGGEKAPSF